MKYKIILEITVDLVINAEITGRLAEQTVSLISFNKYHYSKDFYKNLYQFDVKRKNPLTHWVMKEYTYVLI